MSVHDDRQLSQEECAEIAKRQLEMEFRINRVDTTLNS